MKKYFLYLFLFQILFFVKKDCVCQNFVSSTDAITVATSFVEKKNQSNANINIDELVEFDGIPCYYKIIIGNDKWVIISADKRACPILAYGNDTSFLNNPPEAFNCLIHNFKLQLSQLAVSDDTVNKEVSERWKELLSIRNNNRTLFYDAGTSLLNSIKRGEQRWKQDKNNSNNCDMSYNQYCPTATLIGSCDCDNTPAGCGAVAMGQVMWYWQWPRYSSYRTYDWDNMPGQILSNYTSPNDADKIAHLLKDCGDACGMTYTCPGSWALMSDIVDAFIDDFGFEAVKKYSKGDWTYGNSWKNLIRSEIDNGRPVIFYADNALFVNGHYFVCDGYDPDDDNLFKFNFGWGSSSATVSVNVGNITYNSHDFSYNNKIIVGISPTYEDWDIYDVPYNEVNHEESELANRFIELPGFSSSQLEINNDATYSLTSGKHVILKDGFHAKRGSFFTASIDTSISSGYEISVEMFPTAIIKGVHQFGTIVHNANSWEFIARDRNNNIVYQNAGSLTNNFSAQAAILWNGTGANHDGNYICTIRFRNSYGRMWEDDIPLTVIIGTKSLFKSDTDAYNNKPLQFDDEVFVYPTPSKGRITITSLRNEKIESVVVVDGAGNSLLRFDNVKKSNVEIDISFLPNALYFIRIKTLDNEFLKKIILIK